MKLKSTPIIAGACLLGLTSMNAFAAGQADDAQTVQKLTDRTTSLERQVEELKAELRSLRTAPQAKSENKIFRKHYRKRGSPATAPLSSATGEINGADLPIHPVQILSDKPMHIGGTPVVASPYLGIETQFNASNLITFLPKVNNDLEILRQEKQLQAAYKKLCLPYPGHPFIDLSGNVQATVMDSRPYKGHRTSDIDVSVAELDVNVVFNPWVFAFMAFNFDSASPSSNGMKPRSGNSRVFIDRAFITVGNLTQSPFYGSIGQLYVPFGQYATYMISDPLPKALGRTKARAVVLGFDKVVDANEFNASIYAFKGDSHAYQANGGGLNDKINQAGANIDYHYTQANWKAGIGAGVIGNIADSGGMQNNSASLGFADHNAQTLIHRVPGLNIHGHFKTGPYTLLAEYVTATTDFSKFDVSYNGRGARPQAFNAELNYALSYFCKPTSVAIGYGWTQEALGLGLPKQRYIATLNTSLWQSTIESLEFRHDVDYAASAVARGLGSRTDTSATPTNPVNFGTGHSSDTVTAQFSVFF